MYGNNKPRRRAPSRAAREIWAQRRRVLSYSCCVVLALVVSTATAYGASTSGSVPSMRPAAACPEGSPVLPGGITLPLPSTCSVCGKEVSGLTCVENIASGDVADIETDAQEIATEGQALIQQIEAYAGSEAAALIAQVEAEVAAVEALAGSAQDLPFEASQTAFAAAEASYFTALSQAEADISYANSLDGGLPQTLLNDFGSTYTQFEASLDTVEQAGAAEISAESATPIGDVYSAADAEAGTNLDPTCAPPATPDRFGGCEVTNPFAPDNVGNDGQSATPTSLGFDELGTAVNNPFYLLAEEVGVDTGTAAVTAGNAGLTVAAGSTTLGSTGEAYVYAWPQLSGRVGSTGNLSLVGKTPIKNGLFSLSLASIPNALTALGNGVDGWLHMTVELVTPKGTLETIISRQLDLKNHELLDQFKLPASPLELNRGSNGVVFLPSERAQTAAAQPQATDSCSMAQGPIATVLSSHVIPVRVGEDNIGQDGKFSATFGFGNTETTQAGFSETENTGQASGGVSAIGSYSTSLNFTQGNSSGPDHQYLTSDAKWVHVKVVCAIAGHTQDPNPQYYYVPETHPWVGDLNITGSQTGTCPSDTRYPDIITPHKGGTGADAESMGSTDVTWNNGVDLSAFGVSAQISSSNEKNVSITYDWHFDYDGKSHELCGSNARVPYAERVWSGT